MMTNHAIARSQQRGISPMLIDLLDQFGTTEKAPGGCTKKFFDKSSYKRIKAYAGPLAGLLAQHMDIYTVVSQEGVVITMGHRLERIKRH